VEHLKENNKDLVDAETNRFPDSAYTYLF